MLERGPETRADYEALLATLNGKAIADVVYHDIAYEYEFQGGRGFPMSDHITVYFEPARS